MKEIEYYVTEIDEFQKQAQRLTKKKRFKHLPGQIKELREEQLINGDFQGDLIRHSDNPTPYDVYKLRLPNPDTNVGKSNGYRIIYVVVTEHRIVVLLAIYYKKEQESLSDLYIDGLIDGYFFDSVPFDDEDKHNKKG